jgi:hypothetical protein
LKKGVDKQPHPCYNKDTKNETQNKQKEVIKMFNIFKRKENKKYVITAHGITHVAYTEEEKWDILAMVGYDAQVIETK